MTDDFDAPDTKPGYCPECNSLADIWDQKTRTFHCQLCNWHGRQPKQKFLGWCRATQRLVTE